MSLLGTEQTAQVNRRVVVTCAGFAAVGAVGLSANYVSLMHGSIAARKEPLVIVLMLLVPLVALAALRLSPRTAWAWLTLAGAVFAVPPALDTAQPTLGGTGLGDQLLVVCGATGPTMSLLGLLATGT